ncbi:MAG: acetate kinase [Clostridia bacterium]|nr:acetate kinase [Clostridia bacterium]
MKILVINAGSSSLKYQLFDMEHETVLAKGNCERIGIEGGAIKHKQLVKGVEYSEKIDMPEHSSAMKAVLAALTSPDHGCITNMDEISAIGHRVVHGGSFFSESIIADGDTVEKIKLCRDFAPLHTDASLMGIKGCTDAMPGKPQVLVFDTAFHQTMAPEAYMYGVSYDMYEEYGIRRYGAHGTSHRYVAGEMIKLLDKPEEDTKIVTCHLGNGSSITAVKGGKVVDTSMGFTPLAGVLMGTRSGDFDPAMVTYIMEKKGLTPAEMSNYMNKNCGFGGLCGMTDCRDVEAAAAEGNEKAKLVLDMLAYQVTKYIGSYTAVMGGLDAIVFTAGIGENTPSIRKAVADKLAPLGVKLDEEANAKAKIQSNIVKLTTDDSAVKMYLIPTNEELVIARDTARLVDGLVK